MKRFLELVKFYVFFLVKIMIRQADIHGYLVYLFCTIICIAMPFVGMIVLWILTPYVPVYMIDAVIFILFLIFSPFIALFYLSAFFFNQHFIKDTLGDRNLIGRPRLNSVVFWRKYLKLDTQTGEENG